MPRKPVLIATLLLSFTGCVHATLPLLSDDTDTQGQGGKQIETACIRVGATDRTRALPFIFTYGITDAIDISAGISQQHINPHSGGNEDGKGNPVLGAKYRFYETASDQLSFALKPEISLPVSRDAEARGLGTGKTSYALSLLATQETGFGRLIATLAAYRVNYRDPLLDAAARSNQYLAAVAVLWNLGEQWRLDGEAGGYTQEDRALDRDSRFAQLAAIWSPNDDIDLALGLKRDFNTGSAVVWTTTLGLTYRFQ